MPSSSFIRHMSPPAGISSSGLAVETDGGVVIAPALIARVVAVLVFRRAVVLAGLVAAFDVAGPEIEALTDQDGWLLVFEVRPSTVPGGVADGQLRSQVTAARAAHASGTTR